MANWFEKNILPWIHRPGTYQVEDEEGNNIEKDRFKERDNIWSDFHIFNGEWIKIMQKKEEYNSPHVPDLYEAHKTIYGNIGLDSPYEESYKENQDSGKFTSEMSSTGDLSSGKGEFKLSTKVKCKSPPEGENNFAKVEYDADIEIKYSMPGGITFLPRILAYPLNKFFRWAFTQYVGEDMIEYDGEYARQKLLDYFQYLRKYHGEEPLQSRTRESKFKPAVEDGVFFQ